jgi:hypothetical protein
MPSPLRRQIAGIVATACVATQVLVQLCLVLGLPWGKAAWGGASAELSTELRIASAVGTFIGSILMKQAGYRFLIL